MVSVMGMARVFEDYGEWHSTHAALANATRTVMESFMIGKYIQAA